MRVCVGVGVYTMLLKLLDHYDSALTPHKAWKRLFPTVTVVAALLWLPT